MEHSHLADLSDKETAIEKSVEGATFGLAVGTVWGTVAALLSDHPALEQNVAHPDLVRTLRACGSYGLSFASLGGVNRLLERQRMKKDFVNGAVGAFVAGATVFGLRGRSISAAVVAGSALAVTSMRTRAHRAGPVQPIRSGSRRFVPAQSGSVSGAEYKMTIMPSPRLPPSRPIQNAPLLHVALCHLLQGFSRGTHFSYSAPWRAE
ncbi:Outer envelope pore protein 16-3, chloroplastic/mitochondrial [Ananas comosus]|uniref:Outer envelope pore protein 16-3, chloroplastic/mitochondrial n=1 Tax=Ananas comosus TaxID=4615 RepID=A0A199VJG8_ANACO|nr:Outer envelope pore protein 16-3, chloroplastic/mitochondrial [Ananas comosus]